METLTILPRKDMYSLRTIVALKGGSDAERDQLSNRLKKAKEKSE